MNNFQSMPEKYQAIWYMLHATRAAAVVERCILKQLPYVYAVAKKTLRKPTQQTSDAV